MSDPLVIRRVLGDQPFAQVGVPTVTARSAERGLVACGGDLGFLQWSGRDAGARWSPYRVGVFGTDDLRCRHLVRSHWPVLSLAFHPTLPLLAAGTGSYDGGYLFEGELVLLDLETRRHVSALDDTREVRRVRWLDRGTLELVMAPPDDYKDDDAHGMGHTAIIKRNDWTAVTDRSIEAAELAGPRRAFPLPNEKEAARQALADLGAKHKTTWAPRRQVWAVEQLRDGRILAAVDGAALECWDASGTPQWSVTDPDGARQLHLPPDQQSVWVNIARRNRRIASGWETPPSEIVQLSTSDGAPLNRIVPGYPATITGCSDGRFALRDTRHGRGPSAPLRVFSAQGDELPSADIGGYDLFNHAFDIRHSPELLFLQGDIAKPHHDKRVVTVHDDQVVRLFPLDWEGRRHVFGDPAVWLTDETGSAVVHAGRIHNGRGLLPGNSAIVRRRYPDGAAQWVFTCDHQATALDTDGVAVFAAYNSGEVVALDATSGSVAWRHQLTIDGHATDPLSLTVTTPGQLLIGTVDGRILDCAYEARSPEAGP